MNRLTRTRCHPELGFTLVEIVAVLVILGILAAFALPRFVDLQTMANQKAAEAGVGSLMSAMSMAYSRSLLEPSFPFNASLVCSEVVLSAGMAVQKCTPDVDDGIAVKYGDSTATGTWKRP